MINTERTKKKNEVENKAYPCSYSLEIQIKLSANPTRSFLILHGILYTILLKVVMLKHKILPKMNFTNSQLAGSPESCYSHTLTDFPNSIQRNSCKHDKCVYLGIITRLSNHGDG